MKYYVVYLFVGLILLFQSCKSPADEQTVALPKTYTIDQFYKTTNVGAVEFNADETAILVHSNKTGIFNGYELPVNGDSARPLTASMTESIFMIGYKPGTSDYFYSADKGGNENDHIYLQEAGKDAQDLTPGDKVKAGHLQWARDKKSMFFTSNQRDERYFDIYELDLASLKSKFFYKNDLGFNIGSVSEDKNFVSLTESITTSNSNIYLADLKNKKTTNITPHEGDLAASPMFFSKDNNYLFYLTDQDNEFQYLARQDLISGAKETVYQPSWDVMYAYESESGKYRIVGVNEDGKTAIHIYQVMDNKEIDKLDLGALSINFAFFSPSDNKLGLVAGSSSTPSNIYSHDFVSKKTTQLTQNLSSEIDPTDLVSASVIRFKSYDGLDIPCIQWVPRQASAQNKVPALVFVHGGPGGQTRQNYSSLIQYLTNQGYVVLGINNRGSSGYGKTFFKMDNQKHGDADLKDCIAAKDYLATLAMVDTSRIGIIGGSYGGYMVMAALAFAPEAFDVGVNIFGVTNWLRTLKSIPPYWESFRKALYDEMGDPYTTDSVRLYTISPLFHAARVTKPLMVLQGANDPRVLQVESDEIVAGVKKNGVPVEYVLFPDEGHGFLKKENEIKGYGQVGAFLEKYLKKEVVKN
ncbi:MAG: alpha/beta fold hydrolase [Saprospiraceae bacterium]|nr:alpha/beta fold hydrolase [Saprospiraceae bacterium]